MNRCSFNIYGVINNRLAVCEGIAKFVKLTLNKLGIECFICGGKCILENEKIEDHAWNVIKIEEDYYHIDVTWDIRKDDAQNKRIVSYDYFNLDDANISRDHFDFNMSFECTSMLYNYHAIMGRFISGKKQLIQLLSDGLALGKNFSFRIKRTINTPDNIDDIVVETFNESVKYNGTNAKANEKYVITQTKGESASGVFVSKKSLGNSPQERIDKGALPPSNKANQEKRVALGKNQNVISGKIAQHRRFMNLHIFMREGTLESKQILRKRNKFAERLLK